jgi:putative oxidoreductase
MVDFVASRYTSIAFALLRVMTGFLFMPHGAQKLFGWFGGMGGSGATAQPFTQIWLAGVLEFFGGLLILLGLFTRPVAFVLAGEMAVAYFQAHAPQGFWPLQNRGELAALYCFLYLLFAAAGGGLYSLDAILWKKRPTGTHV